jgi:hypothetical protein
MVLLPALSNRHALRLAQYARTWKLLNMLAPRRAAELLTQIELDEDEEMELAQTEHQVPVDEGVEDLVQLAKSYFDLREYQVISLMLPS